MLLSQGRGSSKSPAQLHQSINVWLRSLWNEKCDIAVSGVKNNSKLDLKCVTEIFHSMNIQLSISELKSAFKAFKLSLDFGLNSF